MKFTARPNDTEQITRWIDVADGPVLADSYSVAGRKFRVDLVHVVYRRRSTAVAFNAESIELHGQALKKDGSDSANRASNTVFRSDREKFPWVMELVSNARPDGGTIIPTNLPDLEA